jgi:hypothetical protein
LRSICLYMYSVPSSRPVHSGFSSNDDPSSMHKQVQLYTGYMYFCIKVSTTIRPCCAYGSIIIAPQCVAINSSLYIFPLINSVRSPCRIAHYCSYIVFRSNNYIACTPAICTVRTQAQNGRTVMVDKHLYSDSRSNLPMLAQRSSTCYISGPVLLRYFNSTFQRTNSIFLLKHFSISISIIDYVLFIFLAREHTMSCVAFAPVVPRRREFAG